MSREDIQTGIHTDKSLGRIHQKKLTETNGLVTQQPCPVTNDHRDNQTHLQSQCIADTGSGLPDEYFSLFDGDP